MEIKWLPKEGGGWSGEGEVKDVAHSQVVSLRVVAEVQVDVHLRPWKFKMITAPQEAALGQAYTNIYPLDKMRSIADFKLLVEGSEILCHQFILRDRSPVFEAMLGK